MEQFRILCIQNLSIIVKIVFGLLVKIDTPFSTDRMCHTNTSVSKMSDTNAQIELSFMD